MTPEPRSIMEGRKPRSSRTAGNRFSSIAFCFKAGGFQVWPRKVEEVIAAHAAVAQVGVAGVADPHRGEAVKAWVVLKPDMQASADDIRAHCRERLAAYKVPR